MNEEHVERFARLFRGLDRAYGKYVLSEGLIATDGEKVKGEGVTIREDLRSRSLPCGLMLRIRRGLARRNYSTSPCVPRSRLITATGTRQPLKCRLAVTCPGLGSFVGTRLLAPNSTL